METSDQTASYSKTNPFAGKLIRNYKLSKEGSGKETRHFEISIKGSNIKYACGDALAILPHNDLELVDEFLEIGNYNGDEVVHWGEGESGPLKKALIEKFNLQYISSDFLQNLNSACDNPADKILTEKFLDSDYKKEFKEEYFDLLDVLIHVPSTKLTAQKLVDSLRLLKPRLYSIASSPTKYPDEIHLCIVINNSFLKGRLRKGVTSNYLSYAIPINEKVEVYIQPTKHFHLPREKEVSMIMVGPGTGVAPFRSFLQEREARSDTGKNWLFFGEQKKEYDFLYGDDFEAMVESRLLTRFDTAFSRDQDFKIYVQDKMKENSRELFKWLEEGAYFFVCGDAKRMAVDVDRVLYEIIQSEGGLGEKQAALYVKSLKKERRYVRDIY